jgi:murein DD-endopeptidase MepM/ murein hydrolase activator NlpD
MALGVALALPSTSATAANGGATPTAVASSASAGGASPDQAPAGGSAARQTGGAIFGRRPAEQTAPPAARRKAATPRRSAPAATPPPATPTPDVPTVAGLFPVTGSYDFGGEDAHFGAGRPGHIHQGQDVLAPSGTPIVSPVEGVVSWKANQPGGAGIYVVVRAVADGRDYVFMHLKRGSVRVAAGNPVSPGQQLAQVGATGRASGAHLHFEIWVGGWQASGGTPIDPLAQLQRWAAG